MRKLFATAAVAALLLNTAGAWAQSSEKLFPQYEFDASLPLQFGTNSLLTPTNPQSSFYVSPFLQFIVGDLKSTTLNYSIYANAGPDIYGRVRTADDGAAAVGGNIQQTVNNFAVGGTYEHGLYYDGVFNTFLFPADDFTGYVGYGYTNGALAIKPSISASYRVSDVIAQERLLTTLKAIISDSLITDKLTLSVIPRLRYYAYTEGTNAGRRDTRAGAVVKLQYLLAQDLSTSGSVEYDSRSSNTAGKSFNDTVFLISLDYSHTADR
jgi:hypothetical protein